MGSKNPQTLYDKLWESHLVQAWEDGNCLLYIDRHIIHEVTSPQAFEGLREAGRKLRKPASILAVPDHNVPTTPDRLSQIKDLQSRQQLELLQKNCQDFGVNYIPIDDIRQGIVHLVGPEQGFTLPGTTVVCGDSHTSTHGAFGALAFGIGTSEVEHAMATQTLILRRSKNMKITVEGMLGLGVTAKDVALAVIGKLGTAGGTGFVIEYCGSAIRDLSMEGRMTLCNMSIEMGARSGLVAPDEKTFEYIKGRALAPKGDLFIQAQDYWKTLKSDENAPFDKEIIIKAEAIQPQVTWGTSPQDVLPITATVPDPGEFSDPQVRENIKRALGYMGLRAGTALSDIDIDVVFIGSCTNSRIEDMRAAASIAKGRYVAPHVRGLVVPGSGLVKKQAEDEGLDRIFLEAGFEWREPGCSMCLAMNEDKLLPHQRCASTSNRNFEGRQGPGGRTHLMSPAMAAAAAIKGKITDVRTFAGEEC